MNIYKITAKFICVCYVAVITKIKTVDTFPLHLNIKKLNT